MTFDVGDLNAATTAQRDAASDRSHHVRVIAGPGTGKSQTIEQRVCWLLQEGVDAGEIAAVSFTRAAAADLGERISRRCQSEGLPAPSKVGTLHSMALGALRRARLLEHYPVDPVVLQEWEVEHIFDAEFQEASGISSKKRRQLIRLDHETFWQTGTHTPPEAPVLADPVTEDERTAFKSFHGPRTQLYACVLPGEIVRLCVARMEAGLLDAADLLGVKHLIVDEFQDLNPMDLRFISSLASNGIQIFLAGDDDQSLYGFRYATPDGIRDFTTEHPQTGDHTLRHCFRCTPAVLDAAQALIRNNASAGRIPKNLTSMYESASPKVTGGFGAWSFTDERAEASAIAASCRRLCAAGLNPREIMILLANRLLAKPIQEALESASVPFVPLREKPLTDEPAGRAILAILSLIVDPENYVAHRTLLGVRKGVGTGTCDAIAREIVKTGRNFRDLFYEDLPDGFLRPRQRAAIAATNALCAEIGDWSKDDVAVDRLDDLCALAGGVVDDEAATSPMRAFLVSLPAGMTINDVTSYLAAAGDDDRRKVLDAFAVRTGLPCETDDLLPERVRVMTMHGSKGLSATVVFIPGLEEDTLPGERRAPYPGQVLEAARMLYVSITRARVACITSFARSRMKFGKREASTPSRFASDLGVPFKPNGQGMDSAMAARVVALSEHL